ncbi:CapA family protein [Planctomicrobium piriforme]|uniref:Uncharacterized protein n=1 Tax=Planctomicrobium piriforme TaxID=1576369 RepID=A0A1I3C0T7_9PLAN|nr:CapA family protein [Planctomicrobium piriforme]SFH68157.1 hypothetical protein SAMN05421753_10235 [Planctomicrobium piriforme]
MLESLLLIGSETGMEAVASAARLAARNCRAYPDISSALDAAGQADLIVVFQHWPDEFPPPEIARLLDACPLGRLMVCLGPWCASFGRTRQFWPAAVCVDETRWLLRLDHEQQVLAGTRPPLPWTAGLDEVFAFDYGQSGRSPKSSALS